MAPRQLLAQLNRSTASSLLKSAAPMFVFRCSEHWSDRSHKVLKQKEEEEEEKKNKNKFVGNTKNYAQSRSSCFSVAEFAGFGYNKGLFSTSSLGGGTQTNAKFFGRGELVRHASTSTDGSSSGAGVEFMNPRELLSSDNLSTTTTPPPTIEGNSVLHSAGEVAADIANNAAAAAASSSAGEVAAAAADCSWPVAALHYVIEAFHVYCGLPWWASIAATTLMMRTLTVPFMISQLKATSRLTLMRPELEEVSNRMKGCTDPQTLEEGKRQVQNLFRQHNVTPFTPLKGMLIQGPIFVSCYFAITNMAANVPSFKTGGALWFLDLSTPDSLYVLPAMTALSFLLTVELNMQEGLEGNPMASKMKTISRIFAFLTVPVTMNFPKAVFCYWITSNLFSLVYGAVVKKPSVKKALNIPIIPVTPETAKVIAGITPKVESKPTTGRVTRDKKSPSSSLLHQRIKALERTVKSRKHGRHR